MLGMLVHAYDPSMWEAKVGGLQRVGGSQDDTAGLCLKKLG